MVEDGGGWWRKATRWQVAADTSTSLHQLPPSSTPSCSPAHLHLHEYTVVAAGRTFLHEDRIARLQLEIVALEQVLSARRVSGHAITPNARGVDLFHPSHDLHGLVRQPIRAERVPSLEPIVRRERVAPEILGAERPRTAVRVHVRVDPGAVRISGRRACELDASDRREHGTAYHQHLAVGIRRVIGAFAVEDAETDRQHAMRSPLRGGADITVGSEVTDDDRAIGELEGARAEQRLEGERQFELTHEPAPMAALQGYEEIRAGHGRDRKS